MEEYINLIKPYLSKHIITISRICYVYKNETDFETGPLELKFTGNMVLHLTGKGDGERLAVNNAHWRDPFAQPLDTDTQEYVQKHGKWTLFDMSDQQPYDRFLGQPLDSLRFIRNQFGTIAGLEMNFKEQMLNFIVNCDEDYVFIEDAVTKLKDLGFFVDYNFFIQ